MSEAILRPGAVALVTGAGSGIGAAIARLLAERGLTVVCCGRNRVKLEEVAARLEGRGVAFELDVTDTVATRELVDRLPANAREVDVLVNNAGHDKGGRRRFDDLDPDDMASVVEANVTGTIRVTHALVPGMLARGRGHVVNIGSIAGLQAGRNNGAYSASKFAVRGLTDGLRLDYAETPLRITEILPGITRTGFAAARHGGDLARAAEFYESFPVTMAPEDVARTVLFALDQPPHVTIAQLVVVPTHNVQ